MSTILRPVFNYLDEGMSVFPVNRQTKMPLVKWLEFQKRLPTKLEWQRWFMTWPNCNVGMVTGYWQHRVVLDFDDKYSFQVWRDGPTGHLAGKTLVVVTGRGYHVHFETEEEPGRSCIAKHNDKRVSVEVKAKGSYVVVPPSLHANGNLYHLMDDTAYPLIVRSLADVLGGFYRPQVIKANTDALKQFIAQKQQNGRVSKVDAIKATFRIEKFLPETEGKQDARGRVGVRCPLPGHDDNHVSFWYSPTEQICACAKCTTQGTWDVINLYAAIHSLTNAQAIDELYQLTPQGMRER